MRLAADQWLLDCCYFYDDLSVYEGFGGVVLSNEEGQRIAQSLGPKNKSIILQNHGYANPANLVLMKGLC